MAALKLRRGIEARETLQRLVREAKSTFSLTEDGRLTAESFAFADFVALFSLCFEHGPNVTSSELNSAIKKGIARVVETGDTDVDAFVSACRAPKRNPRKLVRFALWADLHLEPDLQKPVQFSLGNCRLYIGAKLPKHLSKAPLDDLNFLSVYDTLPPRSYIWGYTKSESDWAAGRELSYAFEQLQALVNFQARWRQPINLFSPNLHHNSAFQVGPNFYALNRETNSWSRIVWMVEHFNAKLWKKIRTRLSAIEPASPAIRHHYKRIHNSPFVDRLSTTLRHMNTSWLSPLISERALALWMALECIYSERSANTDQGTIVRRAVKSMQGREKWMMEQRLYFLREMRNSSVHAYKNFSNVDEQEHVIQIVSRFIISCYLDLLSIDKKIIRNENDLFSYFDSPCDPNVIKNKTAILHYRMSRYTS